MAYTTTIGNYVKFLRGTPTAWEKISDAEKNKDTLYFISEQDGSTGQLYLGSKLIIGEVSKIHKIDDLENVLISEGISANHILVYDNAQEKWVNKSLYDILNDVITVMKGATDSTNGASGLVPVPSKGDNKLFLRGDAKWANPTEEVEATLQVVIGTDVGKSIRDIATEEVLKVVDNAPEAFDTLKEVADWIQSNTTAEDIIKLNNRVVKLETAVGDENSGLIKDVADLTSVSNTMNETLFGDGGSTVGLVTKVSNLENDIVTNSNKITLIEKRLKWQDINE